MNTFTKRLASRMRNMEVPYLRRVAERIHRVNGINLAQGVCQLPVPPEVLTAVKRAVDSGFNRYTSSLGDIRSREALARKLSDFNKISCDPATELAITPGVTGAFEGVCGSLLNPGDEVISFEPYYPYHHNTLKSYGANVRYVKLRAPSWRFDIAELEAAFSPRTKFLLLNTPANPSGKVFSAAELSTIGDLCRRHEVIVVTDEMYEYMTFDGARHLSPASLPEFAGRTITMGGYSKTFSITGWRLGYAVGPATLIEAIARIIDQMYICAPSGPQGALIESLATLNEDFYLDLGKKYQNKRDTFCDALENAGFEVVRPQGAYYIVADYKKSFGEMSSVDFVNFMIDTTHVAAVPVNDFVQDPNGAYWVRFCVAVEDDVLRRGGEQLLRLRTTPLACAAG